MPPAALRLQSSIAHIARGYRWRIWAGAVVVVLATYPLWGGALAGRLVTSVLSSRLGLDVEVDRCWAGLGVLHLRGLTVGGSTAEPPLADVDRLTLPFSALWGGGTILVEGARLELHRGGPRDNLSPVLARFEKRGGGSPGGKPRRLPRLVLEPAP